MAYDINGAILSDTYTFNAGMEYQGQNIGTEIATEELTRKLTNQTDSVKIWCGTFGSKETYANGAVTVTVPAYYYKIIQYHNAGKEVNQCYWMPNLPTEKRALLPQRVVDHATLVRNLGFDPIVVLN